VFNKKMATNHPFWLFLAAFQRAIPFQIKDHPTSKKSIGKF
jgi:hypothetical protein